MKKDKLTQPLMLRFLKPSSIGIYIHIPFCAYRCHYCNFYLETGYSLRILNETVQLIVKECQQQYQKLGYPKVTSLYFGGGTPSLLPAELLEKLLSNLKEVLDCTSCQEITFEMNPESCSEQKLQVLSHHGVHRISLGVQTFKTKFLKVMGRRCNLEEIERALDLLTQKWTDQFSLDIITGYPNQTRRDVEEDIKQALTYRPVHLSLYDLTVEEGTPLEALLGNHTLVALEESDKEELWLYARQLLRSEGYIDYETSNFSLEGYESRHNYTYWRLEPFLGLGPGAVSMCLIQEDKEINAVRLTNSTLYSYRRGEECRVEYIDAQEYLFEHFLVGLRTREGVSKSKLERRFGKKVLAQLDKIFKQEDFNQLNSTQTAWFLSEEGRDLLNGCLFRLQTTFSKQDWRDLRILGY